MQTRQTRTCAALCVLILHLCYTLSSAFFETQNQYPQVSCQQLNMISNRIFIEMNVDMTGPILMNSETQYLLKQLN